MTTRVHAATVAADTSFAPQHEQPAFSLSQLLHKAATVWNRCQIGHRSHYSIERVLALEEYIQRTSFSRVLAVCFLSPIPATAVALVIDCIPLRSPSEGWQANYMLWIRLVLSMSIVSIGLVLQVNGAVAKNTISNASALRISLGSGFAYVAVSIAVAAVLRFPIPFGWVIMVGPYITIFSTNIALSIGISELEKSPVLRQQLFTLLIIVLAQGLVAVAYPIYNAIFIRLSGISQTLFVFVMPMIKFTTKQIIANSAKSLHEYVGPIVVFSVDVFNVFYVSICMQMATSTTTALIFIASDSFHVVLALRDIFRHQTVGLTGNRESRVFEKPPTEYLRDLHTLVNSTFRYQESTVSQRIRVISPFPLQISCESREFVENLQKARVSSRLPNSRNSITVFTKSSVKQSNVGEKRNTGNRVAVASKLNLPTSIVENQRKIHNESDVSPLKKLRTKSLDLGLDTLPRKQHQQPPHFAPSSRTIDNALNANPNEAAVYDALQTLFHSEYVLLAEYIEFVLPVLYSLYLSALFHLPIAAYYPHTQSLTEQKLAQTVAGNLTFAVVEFVTFIGLVIALKRKFGFSPLYQLAFVLETQFCTIQGHLILWNFYILHLRLEHYGVDFNAPFT